MHVFVFLTTHPFLKQRKDRGATFLFWTGSMLRHAVFQPSLLGVLYLDPIFLPKWHESKKRFRWDPRPIGWQLGNAPGPPGLDRTRVINKSSWPLVDFKVPTVAARKKKSNEPHGWKNSTALYLLYIKVGSAARRVVCPSPASRLPRLSGKPGPLGIPPPSPLVDIHD